MAPTHPEILYAQRSSADEAEKNVIYLTIQAPDIQGEPTLNIEAKKVTFQAKTGDASKGVPEKDLACDLELYDEIDPSFTKKTVTSRAIVLVLRKKEAKAEYWPRLTKEKPNKNWIKTDFSKWVDEDEQEDAPVEDEGMGGGMPPGMDMASMMGGGGGGMPGMGGMGGMPGMGGAGGPGGMDFASMMGGMGGAGGAGGAGGMDFAKLMEQMKANGGPGMEGDDFDDEEADEADEAEAEGAAAASSKIEDLDKPE